MMATAPELTVDRKWTVEDYMNLDDDRRVELIEGELLLTPVPTEKHQYFITQFGAEIAIHVRDCELGRVYQAPFDVFLADDTVVQPDLTYVAGDRVEDALNERGAIEAPDLVVEVMSPSTESRDRVDKRRIYAGKGVRWLVFADPRSLVVELFHLDDSGRFVLEQTFAGDETFHLDLFPEFSVDLAKMWAPGSLPDEDAKDEG